MKSNHQLVIYSAAISLIILVSTLFIPVYVETIDEFGKLDFGYPFPFVTQDFYNMLTPPEYFSKSFSITMPHNVATHINAVNFVASFAVVFVIVITMGKGARVIIKLVSSSFGLSGSPG